MLLAPHQSAKSLGELCHRLAVETDAGIDIRRTWQREAASAHGRTRGEYEIVRDAVARGESLSSALAATGQFFPPLFRELVDVGEKTGTLGRVFHRLAGHYRKMIEMQRSFLLAIAWPVIELVLAVFVIGALIWALGIVADRNQGQPIDILGFGLVGNRGLLIYMNIIIGIGLVVTALVIAVRRGALWVRPLQQAVMRLPVLGGSLEKLALARLTWALHLLTNVDMDLRRVVPLALRATGNDYYIHHSQEIASHVAAGHPMHEAFATTGAFPADFLDAFEAAEESGAVVESMERLSRRYEDEAQAALKVLTTLAGVLVGFLVMAVIVLLIFRLAGFYIGTINDALKM